MSWPPKQRSKTEQQVDDLLELWSRHVVWVTTVTGAIVILCVWIGHQQDWTALWIIGLVFGAICSSLLSTVWFLPNYRRNLPHDRRSAGRCPTCGYDLRASPERCPECGTAVAKSRDDADRASV